MAGSREIVILSSSKKSTQATAKRLSGLLSGGEVIILEGDLGSGKTTFVQGLARSLGFKGPVSSPTYVIKKEYPIYKDMTLEHIDAYRVSLDEIKADPVMTEGFGNPVVITVIEWGEKLRELIDEYIFIRFEHIDTNTRRLVLSAVGKRENQILENLQHDVDHR
jgi:tRNA threonylcarbamoyladenosine biosynthesis protein TsaE